MRPEAHPDPNGQDAGGQTLRDPQIPQISADEPDVAWNSEFGFPNNDNLVCMIRRTAFICVICVICGSNTRSSL
jgi:hypothetical protein